jgi:monothiol glutaredoxin
MTTTQIKIIAYLKPHCGWSRGVRAIFDKYKLNYEDRDIIQKSNQTLSPCVEVNGVMLPDISGEELEQYLLAQSLVQHSAADTDVPLDRGCPGHGAPLSDVGEIQTTLSPRKG